MTKEPKLQAGSLDDDLAELKRLLREPHQATSVDLERLAAALRLLSDDLAR